MNANPDTTHLNLHDLGGGDHRHHVHWSGSGRQDIHRRPRRKAGQKICRVDLGRPRGDARSDAGEPVAALKAAAKSSNQVIALDSIIGAIPGLPAEINIVTEEELERLTGGKIVAASARCAGAL